MLLGINLLFSLETCRYLNCAFQKVRLLFNGLKSEVARSTWLDTPNNFKFGFDLPFSMSASLLSLNFVSAMTISGEGTPPTKKSKMNMPEVQHAGMCYAHVACLLIKVRLF